MSRTKSAKSSATVTDNPRVDKFEYIFKFGRVIYRVFNLNFYYLLFLTRPFVRFRFEGVS